MAYLPLSTANLPDPVIDPAQDASPEDYFNTVLYTGNGTTQSITGVGFQPDWLWTKARSNASNHGIVDAVRGTNKLLFTDSTESEYTQAQIDSFDADGFTTSSSGSSINLNGYTYVAWNWKANGSGVTNTAGSITSTVSANTTSGFSIVSYEGTGVAGETIGHGLSQAPDMMIIKNRNYPTGDNWVVYHSANTTQPETEYLWLNTTNATADNSSYWNDTAPTASVFTVGTNGRVNRGPSGYTFIAYCFHSVEGFSKFGSYVGNGSTDGPFVYTGFRPAFVMVKPSNITGSWLLHDTDRNSYNASILELQPNSSGAEYSTSSAGAGDRFDLLSNGFKNRTSNAGANVSGGTYIYMAFAENPFKYSNAR